KIKAGDKFDLNDFRDQLQQVKKLGDMGSLLEKLPAQFSQAASQLQGGQAEQQLRRTEGILNSMTPAERAKPELLKASRKRRIATGAGVSVQEVNRLLNQFEQMQGMMKQMKKGGMAKMMRAMGGMKGLGGSRGFARSAVPCNSCGVSADSRHKPLSAFKHALARIARQHHTVDDRKQGQRGQQPECQLKIRRRGGARRRAQQAFGG